MIELAQLVRAHCFLDCTAGINTYEITSSICLFPPLYLSLSNVLDLIDFKYKRKHKMRLQIHLEQSFTQGS